MLLTAINNRSYSQQLRAADIGGMIGGSYYMGDMNQSKHFYSPHLNIGGIFRYHFNPRVIVRIGGFYTNLSADDSDFSNDFQRQRDHSFHTSLIELSAQVEFNFKPFHIGRSHDREIVPYLQTGIAMYAANASDDFISPALPIGIGLKRTVGTRMIVGIEWTFRRSFSDLLDNITGEDLARYDSNYSTPVESVDWHKQYAFRYANDWYSYLAITLTYGFRIGGLGCPAYYERL